jgi:hypothetical protein
MLDDRNDRPSADQMAGLGIRDHTANETAWAAVLGDRAGGDDVRPSTGRDGLKRADHALPLIRLPPSAGGDCGLCAA